MTQPIELQDIGPVHDLTISLQPGLNVLRGDNGVGKSKTLEAVGRLVGGDQKITRREGAVRGHIEGFGVRISVAASARRTGECEVESLEGRFDVGDLIDPPLKDPAAADRHRIKALLRLTGATADESLFHELLGGKEAFGQIVSPEAGKCDDLVEMAARIKKEIEAASRKESAQAERIEAEAKACETAAEGVDPETPTDQDALQALLEAALADQAKLAERSRAAAQAGQTALEAKRSIAMSEAKHDGPSVQEATEAFQKAEERLSIIAEELEEANKALREAYERVEKIEKMRDTVQSEHREAETIKSAAERREEMLRQWKATVERFEGGDQGPTDEELTEAANRVDAARQAVGMAVLGIRAKEKLAEAAEHRKAAKALREKAERLRDAARSIDSVLSDAVLCDRLNVKEGRLVVVGEDGHEKFYADLSDGERTVLAAEISADASDRLKERSGLPGIMLLPQRCYQDLSPRNRGLLHARLVALHLPCLTALADDGELRAEAFEGATTTS